MPKRRVALLVDLSNALYRACASHLDLSFDYLYTGGLYGFMQAMAKAVRETEATDIYVCADTKPYLRSVAYPSYKRLRRAEGSEGSGFALQEMVQVSKPMVLELCSVLGWPVLSQVGFEADDLIAAVVEWHRCRFDMLYASSNDSDLFQLLDRRRFAVYRDKLSNAVTGATLRSSLGLTPAQYMLATALQGTHNDIEGIKGCGEMRSRQAALDPVLMRKYRDGHAHVIDRNLSLIKLPHPELPRMQLPTHGPFNLRALYRWTSGYGIQVTSAMADSFEQIARGR